MQKIATTLLLVTLFSSVFAQSRFPKNELSINGYRAPSVGLEYRMYKASIHAGYYPTAFKGAKDTKFFKAGVTYWFLPVGKKKIPSSFYAGFNYLRGFNHDYKNKNAAGIETGFRWMIWKGLSLRVGAIGVAAKGESFKLNPASGISYSIIL